MMKRFGGRFVRAERVSVFVSLGLSVSDWSCCQSMLGRRMVRAKIWRRFGFTALTIGLLLIVLILYAAVFVYR